MLKQRHELCLQSNKYFKKNVEKCPMRALESFGTLWNIFKCFQNLCGKLYVY